jgi:hypothetical protein
MNLGDRAISETNCGVSPEGTSIFATGGASIFATDGASVIITDGKSLWDQPHGERVKKELDELKDLLGPPNPQGPEIDLEVLNAHGFAFPQIASDLDAMITDIRTENPNMRIVVNMSFAIVPCEKVTDIVTYTRLLREFIVDENGSDAWVFEQTLDTLFQEGSFRGRLAGPGTFQTELCPEGKPYTACVDYPPEGEPDPNRKLYFVAASGNGIKDENFVSLGVGYPFYPAAWPEVIAVSASDDADHFAVTSPPRASYSNAGRIMMGGTWPPTASIWPWTGILDDYPLMGTSFAAPRYSFVVALYLAEAQDIDVGCGPGLLPPPADSFDWLTAPPPPDKIDQNHCSTLP